MSTDVKSLQKGINELEESINDPILCQKIATAVQTSDFETFAMDANYGGRLSNSMPGIVLTRIICRSASRY